ncbi:MAG TPA: prepilin-type N-terminal cleavage/methylation domain-containing protein [Candidatus Saccharimonadales bacterium]|jgi:prepilin-type N-terminal cleavage/methylation domain-containing protein|nr:prepilin-type N-terminal cleavage/methylation domain-containing protein [Candidatus Saccharimonadales bacterium]
MITNRQQHQHPEFQQGFTIIELMIATAVFSLVLLIAIVAIITVNNSFVKGNIQSQTQDTARSVLSTISQDIQFNSASSIILGTPDGQYGYYCLGNDVYIYQTGQEINTLSSPPIYHALLELTNSCPSNLTADPVGIEYVSYLKEATGGGNSTHELLSQDLSLEQLNIIQVNGNSYEVTLTIGYGDSVITASNPSDDSCPPESLGGNLCAISTLTTTVTPRIQ